MIYERTARKVIRELLTAGKDWGATNIRIYCADDGDLLIDWEAGESDFAKVLPALVENVFDVDTTNILFGKGNWDFLGGFSIVLEYDRRPDEIISDFTDCKFCHDVMLYAEGVA